MTHFREQIAAIISPSLFRMISRGTKRPRGEGETTGKYRHASREEFRERARAKADQILALTRVDWSEYEDDLSDVIGDSIDMDWTSRDGAKAVVRWLETFKPDAVGMSEANKPSPSNPPPEGKVASQREAVARAIADGFDNGNCSFDEQTESMGDRFLMAADAVLASPTEQASDVSGLVEALTVIRAASERSETMFGGKMSDVTRVFQNISRVASLALAQAQQVMP